MAAPIGPDKSNLDPSMFQTPTPEQAEGVQRIDFSDIRCEGIAKCFHIEILEGAKTDDIGSAINVKAVIKITCDDNQDTVLPTDYLIELETGHTSTNDLWDITMSTLSGTPTPSGHSPMIFPRKIGDGIGDGMRIMIDKVDDPNTLEAGRTQCIYPVLILRHKDQSMQNLPSQIFDIANEDYTSVHDCHCCKTNAHPIDTVRNDCEILTNQLNFISKKAKEEGMEIIGWFSMIQELSIEGDNLVMKKLPTSDEPQPFLELGTVSKNNLQT